jgi:hypothetical protein
MNRFSRRRAANVSTACRSSTSVRQAQQGNSPWPSWTIRWPDGNLVMQKQVNAWAPTNKMEVRADYEQRQLLMTGVAEAGTTSWLRKLEHVQRGLRARQ